MWICYKYKSPVNISECVAIERAYSGGEYKIIFIMHYGVKITWCFGGDCKHNNETIEVLEKILKHLQCEEIE